MNNLLELNALRDLIVLEVSKAAEKLSVIKEILTYEEAMSVLNVSRGTLDKMRDEGQVKVYRLRNRMYVKYSELIQTLEDNPLQAA